jgi:hypothetical protein
MKTMSKKIVKAENETSDFKVWCEYCCIRISPNEERIPADGKIYHQRCFAKSGAAAQAKKVAGGKR